MSIKSLAIASTAVIVMASGAAADSYFGFGQTLPDASTVELNLVTAESAGVVEIYDFARGETGDLLGAASVNAGANSDLRIDIGSRNLTDVIAVLKIDGAVVATQAYDIIDG